MRSWASNNVTNSSPGESEYLYKFNCNQPKSWLDFSLWLKATDQQAE